MKKLIKTMLSFAAVVSAVTFSFVSCGPEGPVDGGVQGGGMTQEQLALADSMENALYRQARAMQLVLTESGLLVKSCVAKEQENQYEITLSNGASFPILIGQQDAYTSALTYVEEDGAKFWALRDKNAEETPLSGSDGNKIAVSGSLEVDAVDTKLNLKIQDQMIDMGYTIDDKLQMFDCELLADEEGSVYAVRFIFGDDRSGTLYVSTYTGVRFYLADDQTKKALVELCVDWGTAASVGLYVPQGVDYKFVCTEDWSVVKDESTSLFVITAPEISQDANPNGIITVVSSDETFVFAQLAVTTDPFRTLLASATKVVITPSMGVDKYAYGVSLKSDFNAAEVLNNAVKWIAGDEAPSAGCAVSQGSVSKAFADVLGEELSADQEYVLWAVANGHLKSVEFTKVNVEVETVQTRLLDAEIKVSVTGAAAVFGGVVEKSEESLSDILYQIQNSILDSIPSADKNFLYEGLLTDYPVVDGYRNEMSPATTYLVWAAYAVDGDYEYTESDIFFEEITTNSIVEGGSNTVTFGTPETTTSAISSSIASEGAALIYYAILGNSDGKRYSTQSNDKKYEIMMKNSPTAVIGNSTVVKASKLNPGTTYWIYAVAVDQDGKYGEVSCVSAKTMALQYDESIQLTVTAGEVTSDKIVVKVTSDGGDLSDYVYWTGRKTETFWRTYCGESKFTAEEKMASDPEDENILKAMERYGKLSSDGTIVLDGLLMETEYVFVILEKGENYYSRIGYTMIKTLAADLGNIVKEGTAEWNAAKAAVRLDWKEDRFEAAANSSMTATYGFRFYCPDNLTAYVMAASDMYFSGAGITRTEHIMIEIENYASRRYANGNTPITANGQLAQEPDYYKDGELKGGQLMNVYTFYAHGLPSIGFVTYFAKGSHGENNCIYWEKGRCAQYDAYMESIANFNTLTPWLERAEAFGLSGKEATDWADALLEAYSPYYKDATPIIYENDGSGVDLYAPYAMGPDESGVVSDRVVVMFKDLQGNYYEPMYFEVPNYFEK